jgi:ABC-type sugar transport system permease subunit
MEFHMAEVAITPTYKPVSKTSRFLRKYGMPYLFIAPFFITFLIFALFPLLYAFFLSFHDWDGMSPAKFVGLANFVRLLTVDTFFKQSIVNTFVLGIMCMVPKLTLALLAAVAIHSARLKFKDLYQVIYFLPIITSPVAVAIVFLTIYGQQYGILNYLITSVGLEPVQWLRVSSTIKPAIAILIVWHEVGWYMVIFMAGLQSIPQDLYDAASVDGAGSWASFWRITIPMLQNVILFTVVIDIIGELQIFGEPYILVGAAGGTNRAGLTMSMSLFANAFTNLRFGYSAAQAYIMFAIISIISFVNIKIFGRPGLR